VGFMR